MMPSAESAGSEVVVIKPARVSVGVPVWRTMLWSVQREIWENRSIYIAPAVVAAVVLLSGLSLGLILLYNRATSKGD